MSFSTCFIIIIFTFHENTLQSQLGAAPVAALSIPLDSIVGSQSNPMWERTILPLLFGKLYLGSKSLLRRLFSI